MDFLIGLAIVLGIIYGMIVSSAFRAAALITLGLGAMLLWMFIGDPFGWKQEQARRRLASEQAVVFPKISELTVSDVTLKSSDQKMRLGVPYASYGYWMLDGTVANNSVVEVSSLEFEVTVKDGDRIIAQENVGLCNGYREYSVPAGQARTFQSCALGFKNMPAAQSPVATYRVIAINGRGVQSKAPELLTH